MLSLLLLFRAATGLAPAPSTTSRTYLASLSTHATAEAEARAAAPAPPPPSSLAHRDAVLDLKSVDLPAKLMLSASRDGVVKCWR